MFCLCFPKRFRNLTPYFHSYQPSCSQPPYLSHLFPKEQARWNSVEATRVHVMSLLKPACFPSHPEQEPALSSVASTASLLVLNGSGTPWTKPFALALPSVIYSLTRYIHGSLSPPPDLCWNAASTKLILTTLFKTASSLDSLAVLLAWQSCSLRCLFPYSMYLLRIY